MSFLVGWREKGKGTEWLEARTVNVHFEEGKQGVEVKPENSSRSNLSAWCHRLEEDESYQLVIPDGRKGYKVDQDGVEVLGS